MAADADDVRRLAGGAAALGELTARVSVCRACARLVEGRERVAVEKRASFRSEAYWGRPVTGWGPADARIVVVGMAPAAHGGNRTGRIFTGDRSGDWLFASLYRTGLAVQETSTHAGDGQRLIGARMMAAVRCAPPANKPTPQERDTCLPWLSRELAMAAGSTRVVVPLGGFAWQAVWPALRDAGFALPPRRPPFGHGAEAVMAYGATPVTLLGCYHPSQQNTFTGRVTAGMLDAGFARAAPAPGPCATRAGPHRAPAIPFLPPLPPPAVHPRCIACSRE